MRNLFLVLLLSVLLCPALAVQKATAYEGEQKAIEAVITEAYVKGVHIEQNSELMRKGFHPEFNMLILRDGKIVKYPIHKWIESVEARKKNPPPKAQIAHKIPFINVTGDAAMAKIEIYKDSKHIYSDYMSLYKFADGWKIVNKIFYRHN